MRTRARIYLSVGLYLISISASLRLIAQNPLFTRVRQDVTNSLQDDNSTKKELDRIQSSKLPASQALLTKDLDLAEQEIEEYSSFLASRQTLQAEKQRLQEHQQEAVKAIDNLAALMNNCTKNADEMGKPLASLRDYFREEEDLDAVYINVQINPDDSESCA
jgi:hypothetical protein